MSGHETLLNFIFFKDFIYFFLERGEGREKNNNVQGKQRLAPSHMYVLTCPQNGVRTCPHPRHTPWNQTGNPSVCWKTPNQLSYTNQHALKLLRIKKYKES